MSCVLARFDPSDNGNSQTSFCVSKDVVPRLGRDLRTCYTLILSILLQNLIRVVYVYIIVYMDRLFL